MSLGQEYIDIEDVIFKLKEKKREIDSVIKTHEAMKEDVKAKIIHEHFEEGVCYDDLGIHIRKVSPKPIIKDASLIPEEFMKVKKEIDKSKINAAMKLDTPVKGVVMDNGGYTIMFKAKGN
jgi:hypothetical protein